MNQHLFREQSLLIVGTGLAGSLLAWHLLQHGCSIHIYAGNKPSASRVAAGIINPVTGQRFVLADNTPTMLAYARKCYKELEAALHIQCFHEKPMFRLFSSVKEQQNCEKRFKEDKYHDFLQQTPPTSTLNAEYGGITQQHTAWLDTNTLLDALHAYFEQKNIISYCNFESTNSKQTVIYCQGYHMIHNPLFSWLPLQPAHGEIITCNTGKALPDAMVNKGKWLLPINNHTCRIGATYDTSLTTLTLHDTSKQQLLDFANHVFNHPYHFQITQHQAGIRPTTLDKQPFIGFHPKHQNTAIFNGFGSRGSLLIPWYSQLFTQSLLNNSAIPSEANISRFSDRFST